MALDINDINQSVEQERRDLDNAPLVPNTGMVGRCCFCGQLATDLTLVEVVEHPLTGPTSRYRGRCCGG